MKIFWQEKGDEEGLLVTKTRPVSSFKDVSSRLFFVSDFPLKRKSHLWEGLPKNLFLIAEEEIKHSLEKTAPQKLTLLERRDQPTFPEWVKICEKATKAIEKRRLQKVVLARHTLLRFKEKIDPWKILSQLGTKETTAFLFQFSPEKAYLGLTPEKLYTRDKNHIFTESVAGTRPIETDGTELLKNEKERREFNFVKQFIQERLSPLCTQFSFEKDDRILRAGHVQHLYNLGKGILKEAITDELLLQTLHPTPAVGGTPRDEALSFLKKEPFDRGWYAGAIGWMTPSAASIAVAIRSILIVGECAHLFAGVGFVEGSDPHKEWEELDIKISRYLHYFL